MFTASPRSTATGCRELVYRGPEAGSRSIRERARRRPRSERGVRHPASAPVARAAGSSIKVGSSLRHQRRARRRPRRGRPTGRSRSRRCKARRQEIALVSSGAIAEGMQRLGWLKRPARDPRAAGRRGRRADGARAGVRNGVLGASGCTPRRSCSPTRISPTAGAISTRARRCATLARARRDPRSSTRTTRSRPTRSASATTTRSARWSRT